MQISAQQALLLAVFLTLSNAPALAGNGKVVGGGIARTIECNQTLARTWNSTSSSSACPAIRRTSGAKRLPAPST